MAYSLTWNRTVNQKGQRDTNHPMDLDLEHDNKSFKTDAHTFKGEITDKTITRISRSTEPTDEILLNYGSNTAVRRPSGRHITQSPDDDILAVAEQLQQANVYMSVPGRSHSAFPSIRRDLLDELDMGKLKSWISKSIKKFSKKHYYNGYVWVCSFEGVQGIHCCLGARTIWSAEFHTQDLIFCWY